MKTQQFVMTGKEIIVFSRENSQVTENFLNEIKDLTVYY